MLGETLVVGERVPEVADAVGYDVAYLIHQIRRELGLTQHWAIVIVGIGNLGHALANYKGFAERGFRVAALVDADPAKVGERGRRARDPSRRRPARRSVAEQDVAIGVIATPAAVVAGRRPIGWSRPGSGRS